MVQMPPAAMTSAFTFEHDAKLKHRIAAYRADSGACWYYRLHLPLSALASHHHEYGCAVFSTIMTDQIGMFDLVILQRQYRDEVLTAALWHRQQRGAKLIYEIDDDLFHVPHWNPASTEFHKPQVQDTIKRFLEQMDAVFVTTDQLQKVYSEFCEHVYVLPNSLDFSSYYSNPRNSKRTVVCWQGSNTHKKDIRVLSDFFEKATKDDSIFIKLLSATIPGTYQVPYIDIHGFHQLLSQMDIDIGLAPLVPHMFNSGKSNLKFLEYSAQGAVTVASNVGPYAYTIQDGVTGFLLSNYNEWYPCVKRLVGNPELRASIAQNAFKFVKENFDIEKNYLLWKTALDEVLERPSTKKRPFGNRVFDALGFRKLEQFFPSAGVAEAEVSDVIPLAPKRENPSGGNENV